MLMSKLSVKLVVCFLKIYARDKILIDNSGHLYTLKAVYTPSF